MKTIAFAVCFVWTIGGPQANEEAPKPGHYALEFLSYDRHKSVLIDWSHSTYANRLFYRPTTGMDPVLVDSDSSIVKVLWSPDAKHLVATQHYADPGEELLLFATDDLQLNQIRILGASIPITIENSHQVHRTALSFTSDSSAVYIHLHAQSDNEEQEEIFLVRISDDRVIKRYSVTPSVNEDSTVPGSSWASYPPHRGYTGSLLGLPITSLIGPLDKYEMELSKGTNDKITIEDVRYALENSKFIDPTLEAVRFNAFPLSGSLKLTSKENANDSIHIQLSSIGILGRGSGLPATYFFHYHFPREER